MSALLPLLLLACEQGPSLATRSPPIPTTEAEPAPVSPPATTTAAPDPEGSPGTVEKAVFEHQPRVPCRADADCPHAGCGPCTPGEIPNRVNCTRNPCDGDTVVCGPEHVCVMGPGTVPDPVVFAPRAGAVRISVGAIESSLDAASVGRDVVANRGRFEACAAAEAKPLGPGSIAVAWTITRGTVSAARLVGNTTGHVALGDCFVRAARAMRLDPTLSGEVDTCTWSLEVDASPSQ